MARTITIDKEYIDIIGLDKKFLKLTTFDKKSKLFRITYPEKQVAENIVETSRVSARELEEAQIEWANKVNIFEAQHMETTEVILYKYYAQQDYRNGAGVGFVFMWGVFLRIKDPIEDGRKSVQYFYARGGKNQDGDHISDVWHGESYRERKEWKEIPCTPEAEEFFNRCSDKLQEFHDKMMEFFVHQDLSEKLPLALPFNSPVH